MKKVFLLVSIAAVLFISACGGGGSSAPPAPTAPSAPAGVTITAGDAQVSLSWTAAAGATSYNVYYGLTTGVTTSTATKVTGVTSGGAITGLTNGTTYYFVATAENAVGESAASSEVTAMPVAPPPPSAPAGVTIVSGNAQAVLTWPAVSGATSYNVYYGNTVGVTTANGTKISNTASGTPITGLTNGAGYYFVVTAQNGSSESATSSEAGAVPQAPLIGIPTGLGVSTGENGQVRLSWTAVTGATSYNVYYGSTSGVTPANGTKVTGATSGSAITDLTNGTMYYFIVTAMNNTTENPASPWISAAPKGIPNLMGGAIQKELALTGAVTIAQIKNTSGVATPIDSVQGITTDGTFLYVSANGIYYKILIATSEIVTSWSGWACSSLTTDGNNLYVGMPAIVAKTVIGTPTINPSNVFAGAGLPGYADGVGTAASFNQVDGITMDGTNLYVADRENHAIRKIVIATGNVTTLAGTAGLSGQVDAIGAAARFNAPKGITTDGTNLYVSDTGNNLIRKIVIATGEVTTLAGGYTGLTYDGTGAGARFKAPWGITTDGTNLYVVDSGAYTVRKIVITTGVVTTIAGSADTTGNTNGTGSAALFIAPRNITTDGIGLYVTDFYNISGIIRKIQ